MLLVCFVWLRTARLPILWYIHTLFLASWQPPITFARVLKVLTFSVCLNNGISRSLLSVGFQAVENMCMNVLKYLGRLELVLKVCQSLYIFQIQMQDTQPIEPLKNHVVQIHQAKSLT